MGDEYFNDTQNTVMMNIPNKTATAAASDIHNQYLQENGSLVIQGSKGFIGTTDTPHEVVNKKPIKAIHDLLDKAVSITVDTSAFVYFRNKPGYVIAPLEHLLKSSSVLGNFIHKPAAGNTLADVLVGYNNIIHLRPMAPPSQDTAQGSRSAELDSMSKTGAFFDMNTGNFTIQSGKSGIEKNFAKFGKGQQSLAVIAKELLGGTVKSQFGSRIMNTVINEHRQKREIDKNGPGGYNTKEEAFIASLSFSKKYWISVPMQSGIDVTIGNRINVVYPIGTGITAKTLFVARLIHELQFKTPGQKTFEPVQGTTDMFCVEY
jgi:hypothetical protein